MDLQESIMEIVAGEENNRRVSYYSDIVGVRGSNRGSDFSRAKNFIELWGNIADFFRRITGI